MLDYIKRLGCFDENCTRFYVAEVTEALEYLHSIGIIHRYVHIAVDHCLIREQDSHRWQILLPVHDSQIVLASVYCRAKFVGISAVRLILSYLVAI